MFKRISWCGKVSGMLGLIFLFLGIYLLYEELRTNTFIIHQSIAIAHLCLSAFFFLQLSMKVMEARNNNPCSNNCIKS